MKIIEQSHKILTEINKDVIYYAIELAGRTAYKSEDKIAPNSAERFITGILKSGHESVIEHFAISVRFITDRGITHELVRHRLCAFTQESTRYVNYYKRGMEFVRPVFWEKGTASFYFWENSMQDAENDYNKFLNIFGATPQEARSVLPNSLKTEIVVTANLREWRHILKLRTAKDAHPQMIALMKPLLAELKEKLPVFFADIGSGVKE